MMGRVRGDAAQLADRQACVKLGKCLSKDTCVGERERIPEELCQEEDGGIQ